MADINENEKIWTLLQDIGPSIEFKGVLIWTKAEKIQLGIRDKSTRELAFSIFKHANGRFISYITYVSSSNSEISRKKAYICDNLIDIANSLVGYISSEIELLSSQYGSSSNDFKIRFVRAGQNISEKLNLEIKGTSVEI
jgi:hypothetical protein